MIQQMHQAERTPQRLMELGKSMFSVSTHSDSLALVDRRVMEQIDIDLLQNWLSALGRGVRDPSQTFLGRGAAAVYSLTDQTVVVRQYRRGGFVRHIIEQQFLLPPGKNMQDSRPVMELLALIVLRNAGVRTTTPLAAYVKCSLGGFYYRGILVTEMLARTDNLLLLGRGQGSFQPSREELKTLAFKAGCEAGRMLLAGICHRDLHLGNVLVDEKSEVYLIDFDRAQFVGRVVSYEQLKSALVCRWERSTMKHNLGYANGPFNDGLDSILAGRQ